MVLDGSGPMTELAMHRGLAIMNSRLDKRSGRQVSASDEADAWGELGVSQRYSDTRRALACISVLGGMSIIKAASNLVVSGLGAVHRSGGGSLCVGSLKEHAAQTSCKYIFLEPLDADAPAFWESHGFERCSPWCPSTMGLDSAEAKTLEDVFFIPDPTDCDIMVYSC